MEFTCDVWICIVRESNPAVQSQTAVTAYFSNEQSLTFGFAEQDTLSYPSFYIGGGGGNEFRA